mgnify:CR=1 FL=1
MRGRRREDLHHILSGPASGGGQGEGSSRGLVSLSCRRQRGLSLLLFFSLCSCECQAMYAEGPVKTAKRMHSQSDPFSPRFAGHSEYRLANVVNLGNCGVFFSTSLVSVLRVVCLHRQHRHRTLGRGKKGVPQSRASLSIAREGRKSPTMAGGG